MTTEQHDHKGRTAQHPLVPGPVYKDGSQIKCVTCYVYGPDHKGGTRRGKR